MIQDEDLILYLNNAVRAIKQKWKNVVLNLFSFLKSPL